MKLVDTDALFEKYIKKYMTENAGKFTEEEWEDKIPELYEGFGNMPLKAFDGKTAVEYYSSLSGKELCELLKEHIEEEIPVSDYLCEALVGGDTERGLIAFLKKGTDEELISYAVNILRDKACFTALPIYLSYVTAADTDENLRELMGEMLIENAREIKCELLKAASTAKHGKSFLTEALANCDREEEIFNYLKAEFETTKELSLFAHYFVKYGDERAVELIKKRIADPIIKYADYMELKFAIEALGGEYEDNRDFTSDKTYRKIKNRKN